MKQTIPSVIMSLALLAGQSIVVNDAAAADDTNADVYVVHGIPGSDLGLTADLPVDIAVDGTCAITDLRYKTVNPAVPIPVGQHQIDVYLSDGACTSTLVLSTRVSLAAFETSSIVAYLDQNGTAVASKFTNSVKIVGDDTNATLAAVHTAAAPAVWICVGGTAVTDAIANGDQSFALTLPAGNVPGATIALNSDCSEPVLELDPIDLQAGAAYSAYAVGTPPAEGTDSGTFTVIVQEVTESTDSVTDGGEDGGTGGGTS